MSGLLVEQPFVSLRAFNSLKAPIYPRNRPSWSQCYQKSRLEQSNHPGRQANLASNGQSRSQRSAVVHAMHSGYEVSSQSGAPVKVYEQGKQESKRIVAETLVHAPIAQVWKVLTDYEALPNFVPNLESCQRLPSNKPGRIRLQQRGCSQGVFWRLEAEATLDVEEVVDLPMGRREARFTMVVGDFQQLEGRWVVESSPAATDTGSLTVLRYDISIVPRFTLPSAIVSYVVRAGLPSNIKAIATRAEEVYTQSLQASGFASWAGVEENPPIPGNSDSKIVAMESLPTKGPFWPAGSLYAAAAPITAEKQRRRALSTTTNSAYLGVTSVPLPPAGSLEDTKQQYLDQKEQEKEYLQASYPAFKLNGKRAALKVSNGVGNAATATAAVESATVSEEKQPTVCIPDWSSSSAALAEVHLRRLDQLDFLHRRAVAAITINAPVQDVWEAITDYENLAEFIPNLAVSERIALPPTAPKDVVRLRQVGYKSMFYMRLHAESVLDLIEKPMSEIQFRQVAGDFERFQGKWMIGEAQGESSSSSSEDDDCGPQTQLKYAVEIVIPRAVKLLGIVEPVLERVVFEDIPANLAAIKRHVEAKQIEKQAALLESRGEEVRAASVRRKSSKPKLSDMMEDFSVLAIELERVCGDTRALPSRSKLREMNRTDLEKAIAAHGGPSTVTERLGWRMESKGRKPRGYWDDIENVRSEIDEFITEMGLQPGVVPLKNDFIRASRFDIARAIERWGGLYDLAGELGYQVSSPSRSGSEWQEHISEVAASTGLSGKQGLFKVAAETYKLNKMNEDDDDDDDKKKTYTEMPSIRKEIDAW